MLWMAIAIEISTPSSAPSPKETPTPMPSVNECNVITPTIINAPTASAPRSAPNSTCRRCSSTRRVVTMNAAPRAAPSAVLPRLIPSPSSARPTLAPPMNPAATAVPRPSRFSIRRPSSRGSAPSPVASAVASAARKTARRLMNEPGERKRAARGPPSRCERSRRSTDGRCRLVRRSLLGLAPTERPSEGEHQEADAGEKERDPHHDPEDRETLAHEGHVERRGESGLRDPEVARPVRNRLTRLRVLGGLGLIRGLLALRIQEPTHLRVSAAPARLERVLAHRGCEGPGLGTCVDPLPGDGRVGRADDVLPGEVVANLVDAPYAGADRADADGDEDAACGDASVFEELALHGDSFHW